MIGAMGQYEDNPMSMYVHGKNSLFREEIFILGYVSSRLLRLMKSENEEDHPRVCVTGSRGSSPPPALSLLTFSPYSRRPNSLFNPVLPQLQLPFRNASRNSNLPPRRRRKNVRNANNNKPRPSKPLDRFPHSPRKI